MKIFLALTFMLCSFTQTNETRMKITIGSKVFHAALVDNATTKELKRMLPMTVTMTDLNSNEKYFQLSKDLPMNDSKPGAIHSGDILLYGGNSLVLFYETFSSSYSYTKIGRINDPEGLKEAVGTGKVSVTFELE